MAQMKEFSQLPDLEDLDFETPAYKKRALVAELAGGLYGFPLGGLITVFSVAQITPLPNVPRHILGLANFRNEILPVIDIGTKLHPSRPFSYKEHNRLVKVPFESTSVSIVTERVVDILHYGFEEILSSTDGPSANLPHSWIQEFIRFQEQEICVLNIAAILKELYHEPSH